MMAVWDRFPLTRVVPYWVAQTAGAACASLVLYAMFAETIVEFERQHGLLRGGPGSELSAMMFGEYFPNPAIFGTAEEAWRVISERSAFIAEMIGTAMLGFLVCAVTSDRNAARPLGAAQAVVIGVGVAAIISVLAPLTQAALNPARDFGPRAVSYFLGWDQIAIPGPRGGWLTVYILAPTLGAIIGGGIYKALSTLMPKAGGDGPDAAPD
jgi:glycerol uptake facilitator protein